jgi:hypothetical protein
MRPPSTSTRWNQIPVALRITDQIQARLVERQRAEFDAAAQQTRPTQADGDGIGTQKIFLTETRILAHGDRIRFEREAIEKTEMVAADFDGAAKGGPQARGEKIAQSAVLDGERNRFRGDPKENCQKDDALDPADGRARWRRRWFDGFSARNRFCKGIRHF